MCEEIGLPYTIRTIKNILMCVRFNIFEKKYLYMCGKIVLPFSFTCIINNKNTVKTTFHLISTQWLPPAALPSSLNSTILTRTLASHIARALSLFLRDIMYASLPPVTSPIYQAKHPENLVGCPSATKQQSPLSSG